jgi:prepilin-type N-terminal cleavage/methylation domain-containing protein
VVGVKQQHGCAKNQRGFSLGELLVVILIIGLLAGLLLSVLSASKKTADTSVSVNNLHQTRLAVQLYQESSGGYPLHNLDSVVAGKFLTDPTILKLKPDPFPHGYATRVDECQHGGKPGATKLHSSIETIFAFDGGEYFFLNRDQNPGLLVTMVHGDPDGPPPSGCEGIFTYYLGTRVLAREDGSVKVDKYIDISKRGFRRTCRPALFTSVAPSVVCNISDD